MELEAFLISAVAFAGLLPIHILMCRWLGSEKAVRWMFLGFILYLAAILFYWHRQYQLNVLTLPAWITLWACGLFWCLGYMEAFSMLCRGFSLSILVSLKEHPGARVEELVDSYGGVGAEALMRKRLATIERLGFVESRDGNLRLAKGWPVALAAITLAFKRLLKLGKGG